jgi:hypothetical protein
LGPYSSLETQEMMVEALGPESPFEKVCKIPSVEGNQVGNVNTKGLTPHLSLLHKSWTALSTHIIAKW